MTAYREHPSIWQDSANLKRWPRLEGAASCDVLVIGGGMAGILTAWKLQEQGVDVIVAESYQVGAGVTAGTTAKITSQHGLIYQKLLKSMGTEKAGLYLEAGEKALLEYVKLAERYPCGLERRSNLVYSCRGRGILEKEIKALEVLGLAARFRDPADLAAELPSALAEKADGAVEFPLQAQFHPLKLLKGLTEKAEPENGERSAASGMKIYEDTRILKLKRWKDGGWEAQTEHGMIFADQVVIASHFPFYNRRGLYFLKMYQSRSYAIAGEDGTASAWSGTPDRGQKTQSGHKTQSGLRGMYVDEDEKGLSLRQANGLTIIVGGSSRTGSGAALDGWDKLEAEAASFYPGWKTRYRWAAQDCMTLDEVPYIGPYYGTFDSASGLWVATGFNKWGMTGAMTAAMILSEEIAGRRSPYRAVFDPSRSMAKKQLLVNGAESALNLLRPTVPRCRHLGCALRWNPAEKTWDCSCHGSRYDEEGRCIEGPAKKDLDFRE